MENSTQIVNEDINLAELQLMVDWPFQLYQEVIEKNGFQSVTDQPIDPVITKNLQNYPSLEATPGWMDVDVNYFNQCNDLKTNSPVNESSSTHDYTVFSPAPSSTDSFFTDGENTELVEKQQSDENFKKIIARLGVSEKKIQEFSVKDLNRFLKSNSLTKEEQRCLKNRRRTLKNRGYAQNCRIKRIKVKKSLESENERLTKEIFELRNELEVAKKERDTCKSQLHKIAKYLKAQKNSKVV